MRTLRYQNLNQTDANDSDNKIKTTSMIMVPVHQNCSAVMAIKQVFLVVVVVMLCLHFFI